LRYKQNSKSFYSKTPEIVEFTHMHQINNTQPLHKAQYYICVKVSQTIGKSLQIQNKYKC